MPGWGGLKWFRRSADKWYEKWRNRKLTCSQYLPGYYSLHWKLQFLLILYYEEQRAATEWWDPAATAKKANQAEILTQKTLKIACFSCPTLMAVQKETINSRKKLEYSQNIDRLVQKITIVSFQRQYQRISDSSVVITTQSPQRIPRYLDNCLI